MHPYQYGTYIPFEPDFPLSQYRTAEAAMRSIAGALDRDDLPLTSEATMSTRSVDISVPSDAFELGGILCDSEDVHVELVQFVPTGQAMIPYLWVETDDPAAFERAVRADDRVATLDALDSGPEGTLYRIEWTRSDELGEFLSALVDHDLLIENATGTAERWRFRLRGPNHENISAFHERLQTNGVPVEVHRVWTPTSPANESYGLTDKQRDTIELAFEEGYFTVPREASLTELAEVVGVSRQSVSRRLTRGLHRLVANTLLAEE